MGTEITLEVGGLTIAYSKNHLGMDHGSLFQERDRKRVRSDQINYDYFAEIGDDPGAMEMAFSRSLKEVIPRIELLGFTLDRVKIEYMSCANIWKEERQSLVNDEKETLLDIMSFSEFCAFATAHSVLSLDNTYISSDNRDDAQIFGRFGDTDVTRRIPNSEPFSSHFDAYSERSYFGSLINILHPYSILRVLAENESNLDADVIWQYGPLVDNGWASEQEFIPGARRTETFLIATEGSSDVHILKHAFDLLRHDIADFFRFIDKSKSHPFSGTGSLLKFAEGLAKIDVHNQVVFLFDNDAEGFDAFQKFQALELPTNMRAIILPELEQFHAFPSRGPEGIVEADINRRAAAIECYLDLNLERHAPAQVTWTNYKKNLDSYQGALNDKDAYTNAFLKLTAETLSSSRYDVSKLHAVLGSLVAECTSIASSLHKSNAP